MSAAPRTAWATSLRAIVEREALRFLHQRGRFLSALVRPLVWLLVFAAGFRAALGLPIVPLTRPTSPTRPTSSQGFAG